MGKAVINCCYGGFKISEKAYNWLKEHNIDKELIYKCDFDGFKRFSYYIITFKVKKKINELKSL